MSDPLITTQAAFELLCEEIRQAGIVAFDTEFVSEFTYRPELCLIQIATPKRAVIVDPFEIPRLDAWWEIMLDPAVTVVVHGGREEVRFCLTNTLLPPQNLKDVQIAEGLRGRSFPLGYEALVRRVLGRKAHGRETRTDWRRRPLSKSQLSYALEDVQHLLEIWEKQSRSLKSQKRLPWAEAEFQRMIDEVAAERAPTAWLRLPGLHRLSPRELAVAREVHRWREQESAARNRPVRRTLRDDLIIELARRQPVTEDDLFATRDMNRSEHRRSTAEILAAIQDGLAVPEADLPKRPSDADDDQSHDEQLLGQLLGIALANRCAEMNVAMGLIGKTADLRHLVRWHVYHEKKGGPPRLTEGWRAEVCGDLLTQVLDGKIALRVADPQSDHPLIFERR